MRHSTNLPKKTFAFDLHVLSTPPAFVLSQDQTLQFDILDQPNERSVTYIVLKYIRALFLNYKKMCPLCHIDTWARLLLVVIQFSRIMCSEKQAIAVCQ